MTSEERKAALEKTYRIVQATLDYLIGLHGRTIVYDGDDIIGSYYRQEKQKAEKYYQERKRSRLQVQFKKITKSLEHSMDFNYPIFIKEQTGYTIDLFEQLKVSIEYIISLNEIQTKEQWEEVGRILEYSKRTHANALVIEKLSALMQAYVEKNLKELTHKTKNHRTEIVSRLSLTEHTKVVSVKISNGPKPKHDKERKISSPDKKLNIRINQVAHGKFASTHVNIDFPNAQGTAYYTKGIHDIEAFWKDDNTIVICTTPDHEPMEAYKKVESFDLMVNIEYRL